MFALAPPEKAVIGGGTAAPPNALPPDDHAGLLPVALCGVVLPNADVPAWTNAPKPPLVGLATVGVGVLGCERADCPNEDCPNDGCPNADCPKAGCPKAEVGVDDNLESNPLFPNAEEALDPVLLFPDNVCG